MIAHGVSRGVRVIQEPSPGRGERLRMGDKLFTPCLSPFRGSFIHVPCPTAAAVGYRLAPLRG